MNELSAHGAANLASLPTKKVQDALDEVLQDINKLIIATRDANSTVSDELSFSLSQVASQQHAQVMQTLSVIAARMRADSRSFLVNLDGCLTQQPTTIGSETSSVLVERLIDLHEVSAKHLRMLVEITRAAADEKATSLLDECIKFHVKAAWMLRALLH